jgi:hypothetical protein
VHEHHNGVFVPLSLLIGADLSIVYMSFTIAGINQRHIGLLKFTKSYARLFCLQLSVNSILHMQT